jgi:hypothetical protein
LKFIQNAHKLTNLHHWSEFTLEKVEAFKDKNDVHHRFGDSSLSTFKWLETAKLGDIRHYTPIPHLPKVKHNWANTAKWPIHLSPGKVHVAIGFVDLTIFLNYRIDPQL